MAFVDSLVLPSACGRREELEPTYSPNTYSTRFRDTENPISDRGRWVNGGSTGIDWQDVRCSEGVAFGTGASSGYTDCIACLSGLPTQVHFMRATVRRRRGYKAPGSHEIELLVAWTIDPHLARGYEFNFGLGLDIQAVRWNGGLDDFTVLGNRVSNDGSSKPWTDIARGPGIPGGVVSGDVLKVVLDSSEGVPLLTVYRNNVRILRVEDTSPNRIGAGQPGIGFFARPGAGLDLTAYSLSDLTAGSA